MKSLVIYLLSFGLACCLPSQWEQNTKCGLSESLSLFDQTMVTKSQARKDQLTFMTEFARFMNYKAPELLQEFSQRKKLSETKEKLRRRQFQSEFKDTLTKLESLTQFLSRRQKRNAVIEVSERQNVADGLVDMVEDTADAASDVVEEAVEVAEEVVEETVGVVEDVAEGVSDAASDVVDEITDVVDEVIPGTGDAVDAVSDIGVAAGDLVEDVIQVLTESGSNVLDIFTDVVESVGTALEENLPPSVWNAMCVATWWPLQADHCEAARCVACSPAITTAASVCRNTGLQITHKCIEEVMNEGFCNFCIKEYLEF